MRVGLVAVTFQIEDMGWNQEAREYVTIAHISRRQVRRNERIT
jgi:hypothetical protein